MCYIWINPVTDQMYDQDSLASLLKRHGYERVQCKRDWAGYVREEYRRAADEAGYPVADVRCPAVAELLKREYRDSRLQIPDIEPILIHCAREIGGREDLKGRPKLITTPCRVLADMGNQAGLSDTRFLSWKDFLGELGEAPRARRLDESPIPPGFFDGLSFGTAGATGEDGVRDLLDRGDYGDARILELLWCRDGCHHGDGVIELEAI